MIKYLEYKGRKFPFLITMDCLINFEDETGEEFIITFSSTTSLTKLVRLLILMTKLGLEAGLRETNPSIFKIIWNYIRAGNKIGLRKKSIPYFVSKNYDKLLEIIPDFFHDVQDKALENIDEVIEEIEKKN